MKPRVWHRQPIIISLFAFMCLKSKDAIAKIRELTPCAFNAPIVLMVTICRDEQWVNELEKGFLSGQVDAGIIGNPSDAGGLGTRTGKLLGGSLSAR